MDPMSLIQGLLEIETCFRAQSILSFNMEVSSHEAITLTVFYLAILYWSTNLNLVTINSRMDSS